MLWLKTLFELISLVVGWCIIQEFLGFPTGLFVPLNISSSLSAITGAVIHWSYGLPFYGWTIEKNQSCLLQFTQTSDGFLKIAGNAI